MGKLLTAAQVEAYRRDGYVAPVRVISEDEAGALREKLEAAEAGANGGLVHKFRFKPHLVFTFLDGLVRDSRILDGVEDVLGPDLLCWASSFFTKDAHDTGYVSWHQDSTYWGLEPPDIVSAWLAFTPSRRANGCMRVVPGTHTMGQLDHLDGFADDNLLSRGQEVQVAVDEADAVDLELDPGEMSLHHVRIVHGSNPNPTDVPRIGFVVRYIAAHCRQIGARTPAALVRGEDRYRHFDPLPCPRAEFDPEARALYDAATPVLHSILYRGAAQGPRKRD